MPLCSYFNVCHFSVRKQTIENVRLLPFYLTEVSSVSLNGILSEPLNIGLSIVQCSGIGPRVFISSMESDVHTVS